MANKKTPLPQSQKLKKQMVLLPMFGMENLHNWEGPL